jgi:hypothetical protein
VAGDGEIVLKPAAENLQSRNKISLVNFRCGRTDQTMKNLAFVVAIWAATFSSVADSTNSLENFSPHFLANTEIIWLIPTNQLPKSFWIYKRLPPRPFLASVISNAIVFASLQDKGFPKPSTNAFFIWSTPDPCGTSFSIFSILPAATTISFSPPNQNSSTDNIPDNKTVTKRAFEYAARFGLDRTHLIPKGVYCVSNSPGCDGILSNDICARGIFLSRKLDGIGFYGDANNGSDGFSIEFGSRGQIRSFSLVWPNLEREQNSPTASLQQITDCIRAHKVIVIPNADEEKYFDRVKSLANAKAFTITKITPYYGEGILGEVPTNDVPPEFIIPIAELEAVANFGNSNINIRLLSPIISSEVNRLLKSK